MCLGFAGSRIVTDQFWMATNLPQAGESGQDVNLAFVEAFLGDGLHDLLAAAAQFGQVKFALLVTKLAIAALLDAIGQIFGDVLFQAAQEQGPKPGRKTAAGAALGRCGVVAARFAGSETLLLAGDATRSD